MTQAMLTFVAPLAVTRLAEAEAAIDALGNPANDDVQVALKPAPGEEEGTHFCSLHALRTTDGRAANIVFEISADGTEEAATERIARTLGPHLKPVLMLASDWPGGDVAAYLAAHSVKLNNGLFGNPGVAFSGTPGLTVGRILFEQDLAQFCAGIVESFGLDGGAAANLLALPAEGHEGAEPLVIPPKPALSRLAEVRAAVARDRRFRGALDPATPAPPFTAGNLRGLIGAGIVQFIGLYLWPLVALVALASLVAGIVDARAAVGFWHGAGAFLLGAVRTAWGGFWIALAVVVAGAVAAYFALRDAEENDSIETHTAQPKRDREMYERENRLAQSHMISITQRKPGWLRWFTARLVFWIVGLAAGRYFKPGFLSDIGTIHFARWVTVPGTRDTLFMSNYGGSWESYLEDFITKAHAGLTAVWSNTVGFPKTQNLFQLGATDGDRFKRFARHSMVPTRFWYSAYRESTTGTIRANALIRAGLSGVMTEDEAINWLALFGSAARPSVNLVSSDIQSLVFGGLGFMPFGTCLICHLSDDRALARDWLARLRHFVAFSDGRRLGHEAVATLALSPGGLRKLGLPEEAAATFPLAFQDGMTALYRQRILGDTEDSAPEKWRWGNDAPDAAVLVYGRSQKAMEDLRGVLVDTLFPRTGTRLTHEVPLKPVTADKREPFGFVDGISQPVIRGTYKGRRNSDAIHVVEPGEMILGYPDDRGYIPPSPTLPAGRDPSNKLPLLGAPNDFSRTVAGTPRDVGFNGTFLIIRELEQHVDRFEDYCADEAERLNPEYAAWIRGKMRAGTDRRDAWADRHEYVKQVQDQRAARLSSGTTEPMKGRLGAPYVVDPDFIAAKLIGRWKDGSSLVREPYEAASVRRDRVQRRVEERAAESPLDLVTESASALQPARPKSHPRGGTPIDPDASLPAEIVARATEPEPSRRERRSIVPDNDFLFGVEDPRGLRCPYGAHIRRANPRDSLFPGDADQVGISNRHRITRVGRFYEPGDEPDRPGGKADPGLFFMCFCADIERQFEFLQQTWLKCPGFHDLGREADPLLGGANGANDTFTMPTPDGPIGLNPMQRFVSTRGGGYFFLPGRRLIDFLVDPT